MRTLLCMTVCLMGVLPAKSDTEAEPRAMIFTPTYPGDVCFCMMPPVYAEKSEEIVKEGYGIVYRLLSNGKLEELYRTNGWYSYKVFVSYDGRYLVQMGPWNRGKEVDEKHLAIAFHKDGKLLKKYSTAELVKDPKQIQLSASHYRWLLAGSRGGTETRRLSGEERETFRPCLDSDQKFTLTTIDGWTYVFDATTGEIISTKDIME